MQRAAEVAAEYAAAKAAGNFEVAAVIAGEAVGLIHDIPPAAEIVERIAIEAEQLLAGRRNSVSSFPSPLVEKVARMQSAPDEGSVSADTNPSPVSPLRGDPPSRTRGEGRANMRQELCGLTVD